MPTAQKRTYWFALLWLVVPWVATADDPEHWPTSGLELRVDAPGPWLAGVPQVFVVTVHEAPTALTLRPASGALVEVKIVPGAEGRIVRASARADAEGRAVVTIPMPDLAGPASVTVRARRAAAGRETIQELPIEDPRVALVRTDRQLYEPGEEVGIRLLVTRRPDLRPHDAAPVAVAVVSADGGTVHEQILTTSRFGIASTDLLLPPRARTGTYRVVARADGAEVGSASFMVAHRVLPRFRVTLALDRGFAPPGQSFRARVRADYLHGPPVRDAVVRLLDGEAVERGRAILDPGGQADVELTAPDRAGPLALVADVRAPDGSVAKANAVLVVDPEPMRVSVEPEGQTLAPGLANRVQVSAVRPDGTPVRGRVELTVATASVRAELGQDGSAELVVDVGNDALEHSAGPCGSSFGWVATVQVAPEPASGGLPYRSEACLRVDPSVGLLLRAPEDALAVGAPVPVEVIAPRGTDGVVAEAFFQGAPVSRGVLRREGGAWRAALALPAGLVGPVALRARSTPARDEASSSSATRTVHVRPASLTIAIDGADETLRPRSTTRLGARVRDAAGRPVQAALGVAIVDEAAELAAAMPERPPAAQELTGTEAPAPRDDAPWADPEERRRALVEETLPSIFRTVEARLASNGVDAVGIFEDGRWRFRRELLRVLAENGEISGSTEGLGGRPLELSDVEAYDPSFRFDGVAARITRSRLVALLIQLRDAALARGADLRLRPALDLARLREDLGVRGELDPSASRDAWGRPLFVRRASRPRFVLSRALDGWEIGSAGPDGVVGNADDLVDPLRAPIPRESPYGRAVGEPGGGADLSSELLASEMLDALATRVEPMGTGHGAAGFGAGFGAGHGHGARAPSIRVAHARVGGGAAGPAVRDRFPKTLLWLPELVTDAEGAAFIPLELADSLTTWKVRLVASSLDGAIGEATTSLVVSQPLFVDVSAPPAWTAGDRIAVPVAVHNHTGTAREVVVRVQARGALALDEAPEAILHVPADGVALHRVAVKAHAAGAGTLLVSATTPGESDAAERSVTVLSAAREAFASASGVLEGQASVPIEVPDHALPGTASLRVRVHGGFATIAMDGLESLLREPCGCFEQTSSATYPNILVLGHLARSGDGSAEVLQRARELVDQGYDRLRSYEVRGGGFSWFGEAPANLVLTAYGLREFTDMAEVRPVDAALLGRTREFLLRHQQPNGSWSEPSAGIPEGVTNLVAKRELRTTAYVAWSLAHAGVPRERLRSTAAWLRSQAIATTDRYGLALTALALAAIDPADDTGRARLRQLVGAGSGARGPLSLDAGPEEGLMHGGGDALDVELSALAALAAAKSRAPVGARLGAGLVEARQGTGGWGTTQATVLSLQALLALSGRRPLEAPVDVAVELDGRPVGTAHLRPDATSTAASVEVPALVPGRHEVRLRALGPGVPALVFDATARYEEAFQRRAVDAGLAVRVDVAEGAMQLDEARPMRVRVRNDSGARVEMLMARIGIPAGFEADTAGLVALRERGTVSLVEDGGRTIDVYLPRLERGATLELPLRLVARQPGRVTAPPSTVYAYYEPELQGTSPPFGLTVVRR